MSHPRCPDCPIVGVCVVSWTAHRPFCDWARRGGLYLARVRELSAAGPPPPDDVAGRPSAPEALALVRQMRACQFWSRDAGCGCSGARCGLKNGELVNHQDCFTCLERYDAEP